MVLVQKKLQRRPKSTLEAIPPRPMGIQFIAYLDCREKGMWCVCQPGCALGAI